MKKIFASTAVVMLVSLLLAIAVGIAVLIGTNVLYVAMGKEGVLVALLGGAAILGILLLVIDRVKRK
ncbi:hypothetical protein KGMB01110_14310 [Mediterraneibacter butyricigenes]|uniref:Uncharacterized protein n=1 Tax=Mediterraneibacter butyricigenes TaxID=2316025 RepID=A0A391P0U2_9FIRM|nr:hypothetical protein [Mediterraneibacter butyricigenes]GCA66995.1 hypothetical protein KGMB01110_14310 [Mediterraneibacter butyricigenes]